MKIDLPSSLLQLRTTCVKEEHAPIFIVGASRSGTTMLRLMLNAHPRLAVPNEIGYFDFFPAEVKPERWRDPGFSEMQYRGFVQRFLRWRARIFENVGLEQLSRQIFRDSARDLRTPYQRALQAWAQQQGKTRWGEKTPHNLFYVDVLADMFPNAKFVHLVRDPRAVVRSMNDIEYFSEDAVLNSFNWRQAAVQGYALLRASVRDAQRITIRYEDLICDTEEQIKILCNFLGESFENEMLGFHRNTHRHIKHTIRTPAVTKPVNRDSLDKWKRELSESEVAAIESICGETMQRFGYERRERALTLQEKIEVAPKAMYWKVQRWRRRDKRGYEVSHQFLGRTKRRLRELLGRPSEPANLDARGDCGHD